MSTMSRLVIQYSTTSHHGVLSIVGENGRRCHRIYTRLVFDNGITKGDKRNDT